MTLSRSDPDARTEYELDRGRAADYHFLTCLNCGHQWDCDGPPWTCPKCEEEP